MKPQTVLKTVLLILTVFSILTSIAFTVHSAESSDDDYYAIVYIVDALRPDLFRQMIDDGRLPNLKKYLFDNGLMGEDFLSVFPSITLPAMTTLMTGKYPGSHNIPAFQWFDRETFSYRCYIGAEIVHFDKDLSKNTKRIFDYFPAGETASFGIIAGATTGTDDSLMFTSINPLHKIAPFTHLMMKDLLAKIGIGKGVPRLMALYEWGVILRSYQNEMYSEKVKDVMSTVDKHFGGLIKAYERRGILDKTYLVLVSDHGLHRVDKNFYLDTSLKEAGFSKRLISYNLGEPYVPFTQEADEKPSRAPFLPFYEDRVDSLFGVSIDKREYHLVFGSNAGGAAILYLAKNGGYKDNDTWSRDVWKEPVVYDDLTRYYLGPEKGYVDVIDLLRNCEGVDFFIVRDNLFVYGEELRVRVISKNGQAMITRQGSHSHNYIFKYEVLEGSDPLGYALTESTGKLMDGQFYHADRWLSASKGCMYPDACSQLTQVFQTERSGTVIVSCAGSWSVNSRVVNKHGGLLADEMISTFCISGPGINRGIITGGRSVDMAPSLLYLLNKQFDPEDFDGKVISELRQAVERRSVKSSDSSSALIEDQKSQR
ncbi:MAG: alkaline phosphatase family protein [Candidatus Auribacterota bacterium]|jgi:hypothetical protein|nr:alkaline phosphatase family protein [Candidatus Auribacterota bacterium]